MLCGSFTGETRGEHDFPNGFFDDNKAPKVGTHTAPLKAYHIELRKIGASMMGEEEEGLFDTLEEAMAARQEAFEDPIFQDAHWDLMKAAAAKKARRS